MREEATYDWERFWIHFIFGALLGGGTGFLFWLSNWHPGLSVWVCISIPSLAVALLGGIYGDRFWDGFMNFVGRWGWWV
jgi:hypothetical protein